MSMNQALLIELDMEAGRTRTMLERVPDGKFDWKPHDKSYSLGALASHIAEIPNWMDATLNMDELDFETFEYKPPVATNNAELLQIFDECIAKAREHLQNATDEQLMSDWTMRMGDKIFFTVPKIGVVRDFIFNHTVHHRGQLSVYLRLNDVPLPGIYGPTADEPDM